MGIHIDRSLPVILAFLCVRRHLMFVRGQSYYAEQRDMFGTLELVKNEQFAPYRNDGF